MSRHPYSFTFTSTLSPSFPHTLSISTSSPSLPLLYPRLYLTSPHLSSLPRRYSHPTSIPSNTPVPTSTPPVRLEKDHTSLFTRYRVFSLRCTNPGLIYGVYISRSTGSVQGSPYIITTRLFHLRTLPVSLRGGPVLSTT